MSNEDKDRSLVLESVEESARARGMRMLYDKIHLDLSLEGRTLAQAMIDEQNKKADDTFNALHKYRQSVLEDLRDE